MGRKLNKLKKIRIHREGTHTLIAGAGVLLLFNACLYYAFECKLPFYISATVCTVIYLIVVNFFRCPVRRFEGDTENVVVAPADGKIVVIEEVDENEYFHDRRLMVSIFMSLTNVHANWIPVDGTVTETFIRLGCRRPALRMNVPLSSSKHRTGSSSWPGRLPVPWLDAS